MKKKDVYLVAKYAAKPRKKHATAQAGYMKNPANIQWDEQVVITVGLKNKDFLSARVVLNISKQSIVRNSFQNDKTFEEFFQYFYTANPQEISRGLQQVGITVGKKEQQDGLQENVSGQEEAGPGSESPTTADSTRSGQGPTLDEGSATVAAEPDTATAG